MEIEVGRKSFRPTHRIYGFSPVSRLPRAPDYRPGSGTGSRFWVAYINHKDNAAKYDKDEVRVIKNRIKDAAEKHGVEIEAD